MGQPAARLGDPAGHGGALVFGAPTVLIGGMPAARVGDPLVCPGFTGPVPHIIGNVMLGSFTVMIFGAFAARLGDMTGCGVAGVSGTGMPPVAGPPAPPAAPAIPGAITPQEGSVVGDANVGLLYGQHTGYSNASGQSDTVKGSMEHFGGEHKFAGGGAASGSIDVLTGTAEYHAAHSGFGGGASASVSGASAKGQITDAQGNSAGASGGLLNASAGIDTLLGSDGRRTGIALGASLQASVAEGQIDTTKVVPIPFTDYTLNLGGTVGGSVESVGGAGAVGAYHDAQDDRYHMMGMIDLELVIGAKLGMDISFGHAATPPAPPSPSGGTPGIGIPMTPGSIMMGCPTVLIG